MSVQRVFVLNHDRSPLSPCHPARARQLLRGGRAAVLRRYPCTIILKAQVELSEGEPPESYTLKLDPGSRTTGIAIVRERDRQVVWAGELGHRGQRVRDALLARRQLRRGRRSRKTRYRKPRFLNRRRPAGWLPPSLESRIANILTWVHRLSRYCLVTGLALELVKFDTRALQNPEVEGVEYQRGELFGCEVWEYLLAKWGHRCAYCGKQNVPLEKEHIVPKSRGGSDRVSNLCPSCRACNEQKGTKTASGFGHPEVEAQAKQPLKDAAAVNSTRWALFGRLGQTGLTVETGTGGRTRYSRASQGYPKAHWIDAACVGESGEKVLLDPTQPVLAIQARGHGVRQRCRTDKYGFPTRHAPRAKFYRGFQTGDLVRAVVPKGKHQGVHEGRVAIRFSANFRVGKRDGINPKYLRLIQRADGYEYNYQATNHQSATEEKEGRRGGPGPAGAGRGASSPCLKTGVSAPLR